MSALRPSRHRYKGWPVWLGMVAVVAVLLVVGGIRHNGARSNQERVDAIAKTIKCPTCRSESVFESRAQASAGIRDEIARQVQAGQSNDAIRRFLADRYGSDILLVPPAGGVNGLVWALPVGVLVLAIGGLVVVFRRWRERSSSGPSDDDRALVERVLHESAPGADQA